MIQRYLPLIDQSSLLKSVLMSLPECVLHVTFTAMFSQNALEVLKSLLGK